MENIDQNYQVTRERENGGGYVSSNDTVAQISCVEQREDHNVYNYSRRRDPKWSLSEKQRLVQIDTEERRKGPGFMARVKERCEDCEGNAKDGLDGK